MSVRARAAERGWLVPATVVACIAALATAVTQSALPAGDDYTKGFAPWWVSAISAVLGASVASAMQRPGAVRLPRRAVLVVAWSATILLIWSAGGIVFDMLRTLAVLGVPGLPPVVDWAGFAARAAALAATALLAAATLSHARATAAACAGCGRGTTRPPGSWSGYAACLLVLPYPALKVYWALGGRVARAAIGTESVEGFPIAELVLFGAAAVLGLALVQSWGRVFPRWMLLAGGWTATGVLLSMGALAGLGTITQALGLVDGPVRFDGAARIVALVYGSWLLLGLAFGAATLGYQRRTQPSCERCVRLSAA
ncbi:hypothetical protein ACIBTZ_16950 [Micromonospora sp. NPDC049460]|uniref:hypothetical protein n=1 Tax=unclassified Micromonospora TaxID=2617518 RepID=UPI00371A7220